MFNGVGGGGGTVKHLDRFIGAKLASTWWKIARQLYKWQMKRADETVGAQFSSGNSISRGASA